MIILGVGNAATRGTRGEDIDTHRADRDSCTGATRRGQARYQRSLVSGIRLVMEVVLVGDQVQVMVKQVRRLRARRAVDARDELRLLPRVAEQMSQTELARALGVSQPAVSGRLRKAADVPPVREGFSGSDPYEIAQRYAAGLISREQVVEELSRWEYRPADRGDGVDWGSYEPGEWYEFVVPALDHGLLEADVYSEIQSRVADAPPAGRP